MSVRSDVAQLILDSVTFGMSCMYTDDSEDACKSFLKAIVANTVTPFLNSHLINNNNNNLLIILCLFAIQDMFVDCM
jgi:hypothetical protein